MFGNRVSSKGAAPLRRERLTIEGTVQGVGFRPFVYRLARRIGLSGYVKNTSTGAVVEIEGTADAIAEFKQALPARKPSQANLTKLHTTMLLTTGKLENFFIESSESGEETSVNIPPDLAVCADCLREMNDQNDRRFRYPFINCTNCGPRYSIITGLPYDRPNTTMHAFDMCDVCRNEYENPTNRRYHAQAIACPDCGPQLELLNADGQRVAGGDGALLDAAQAVCDGKILALKGLGGFQLICDARNKLAVAELRRRKHRAAKPLAVMYPSLDLVRKDCSLLSAEVELLTSAAAPIVLVVRNSGASLVSNVAPGNANLGAMLASTPLHHLLMSELGFPVVATSGNRSGEPICIGNEEVVDLLNGIADVFLVHERHIAGRCDDSVVRMMAGRKTILRRARGYAPSPIEIKNEFSAPLLAVGGHLKNTVALGVRNRVFISPHIGDLETPKGREAHRQTAETLRRLYKAEASYVVHDLHPDYHSTRMAKASGIEAVAVQHHYAHALACMADNGIQAPCLAVTWDGSGYGLDNTLWGGEFLTVHQTGFDRVLHFLPFPLAGGETAMRDPKRAALGMLYVLEGDDAFNREIGLADQEASLLRRALNKNINCPLTSSAGRIFDAVGALTGVCTMNSFEGQTAMALEHLADPGAHHSYQFAIDDVNIDWRPMLRGILTDINDGVEPSVISGKFHATLAAMIRAAAKHCGEEAVLLTGGCFQNALLVERAIDALEQSGFTVYTHREVPPNDGGLALGQAMALLQAEPLKQGV